MTATQTRPGRRCEWPDCTRIDATLVPIGPGTAIHLCLEHERELERKDNG